MTYQTDQKRDPVDILAERIQMKGANAARPKNLLDTLKSWAVILYTAAGLYGILGIIGSIVLMTRTSETDGDYFGTDTTHPFVGVGLASMLFVVISSVFIIVFGLWAEAWAIRAKKSV